MKFIEYHIKNEEQNGVWVQHGLFALVIMWLIAAAQSRKRAS